MAKRNLVNSDKDRLIRRKKQKAQTEQTRVQPSLHERISADVHLLHRTIGNAAFTETLKNDPAQHQIPSEKPTLEEDLHIITNRKIERKQHDTVTGFMNRPFVPVIQRTLGSEMESPPAAQFGQGRPPGQGKPTPEGNTSFPTTSGIQVKSLEEIFKGHNFKQNEMDKIQEVYQAAQHIAEILNGKVNYMFGGSFAALLQGNKRIPGDLDIDVFDTSGLNEVQRQLENNKYIVSRTDTHVKTSSNGIEIEAVSIEAFSPVSYERPSEVFTKGNGMNLASGKYLLISYLSRYDNSSKNDKESVKNMIQANRLTEGYIDELLKLSMSPKQKEKVSKNWREVWQEIDKAQNDAFLKEYGYGESERQALLNAQ